MSGRQTGGVMKSRSGRCGNSNANRYRLRPKELEVLRLLPKARNRKEIGEKLHLSIHTVDTYLHKAYQKLGVRNEREAVAKLLNEHLFAEEDGMD